MDKRLPNIIFIVMDTMGAKHMSLYGYHRQTTPFLESLAANATVYSRCFATSSWTIPSHASMFTGLYPSQHGAFEGKLWLSQNIQHLVSVLKMRGYQTFGISSNGLVSPSSGLCRDFDYFKDFTSAYLHDGIPRPKGEGGTAVLEKSGEFSERLSKGINSFEKFKIMLRYLGETGKWQEPLERIKEGVLYRLKHFIKPNPFFNSAIYTQKSIDISADIFAKQITDKKPFFLFINFMEPHEKYRPPLRYRKFSRWLDKQKANMTGFYFQDKTPHFDTLLKMNRDLYDDEIYYLDQKIKDFFSLLERQDLLENTVVIITSDHGESFGEKGIFGHNLSLYNELIWVPLIVRYQAGMAAQGENDRLVSLTDLYATVLDLAQCPLPHPESSYSLMNSPARKFAVAQFVYPEKDKNELQALVDDYAAQGLEFSPGILALVMASGKKLIQKRDGKLEMYDFLTDKDERHNLIESLKENMIDEFSAMLEFLKHDTGYDKAVAEAEEAYQDEESQIDLTYY